MRKLVTLICALGMIFAGYTIVDNLGTPSDISFKQNTLVAATMPQTQITARQVLPMQDEYEIRQRPDTVYKCDTVKLVTTKYVKVSVPKRTTDTLYVNQGFLPEVLVSSVKNKSPGVREEQTQDEIVAEPTIVLTVDGKTVYTSESDNHSGRVLNDSTSVSDEPLKL